LGAIYYKKINKWVDFVTKYMIFQQTGRKMFDRNVISFLHSWENSENRKPLIIRGARQVGKTTAVKMFAGKYSGFMYLDLEAPGVKKIFQKKLPAKDVLAAIRLRLNNDASIEDSLLFVDEIQNCPESLSYLRHFYETIPNLKVIASGSLLDIMLHRNTIEFPVGRVEFCFMHPVTFLEYLGAISRTDLIEAMETVPFPEYAHGVIQNELSNYIRMGGMPEVIASSAKNVNSAALSRIMTSLIVSFEDDISKYAKNENKTKILRHCIESVPDETGKRIKFAGFGNSAYRSREVGESLRTLQRAMLLSLVYPTNEVALPAGVNRRKSPRLQYLDVGLLSHAMGIQDSLFVPEELNSLYKGVIAEQFIGQELLALHTERRPFVKFWAREKHGSSAEVDFVIEHNGLRIPVEVKSGKTGTLRSLAQYMAVCSHGFAIRFYQGAVRTDDIETPSGKKYKLLSLPHFLVGKVHDYLDRFLELKD